MRGVADSMPEGADEAAPISVDEAVRLANRAHTLPGRPCGRDICWLIGKWHGASWPDSVVEAVVWYAIHHPDPETELWRQDDGSGRAHYRDPYMAGINSVRGSAARCLARLLFDKPERFPLLKTTIGQLVCDPSVAVRSCVSELLLAAFNVSPADAINWFKVLVQTDDALLGTPNVERFIHFAGYRDYRAVSEILQRMLIPSNGAATEAAARQVCLLALDVAEAETDAQNVRTGNEVMRKAAANVYAVNAAHPAVGEKCRTLLKPFFVDSSEAVRAETARVFRDYASLATDQQALLLSGFIQSESGPEATERVVRAIEESPVQLPTLVCDLLAKAVAVFRDEAGDMSKRGAAVAHEISKIVVRLYAQSNNDADIQSRCLDLIDEMEKHGFLGLAEELNRLDR